MAVTAIDNVHLVKRIFVIPVIESLSLKAISLPEQKTAGIGRLARAQFISHVTQCNKQPVGNASPDFILYRSTHEYLRRDNIIIIIYKSQCMPSTPFL